MVDKSAPKSIFGPKPKKCPAKFHHCGDCDIYPCLIGAPAYVEGIAEHNLRSGALVEDIPLEEIEYD